MAIIRYPTLDQTQQGEDAGTAYKAYVDTATGQVLKEVKTGNSEDGFQTTFQPVAGKTWEFANRAGTGGQQIYGSQGYVPQQFTQNGEDTGFSSGAAGAITPRGDWQVGDWQADKKLSDFLQQNGVTPKYDPAYGWVIPAESNPGALMTKYRDSIYTGGGSGLDGMITNFLDSGGAVKALMAAVGAGALSGFGGGLDSLGTLAGDAYMPAALGAEGTGSVGALGSGLAGDAYMPAALGADGGISTSLGELANTITPQVAGTSTLMPYEPPIPTINGAMPTEINPATWTGPSLTDIPTNLLGGGQTPATAQLPATTPVETAPVGGGVGGPTATTASGTAISRILNGTATTEDWLSVGGNLGTGLLSAYASNSQADALKGIADQNRAERAPFLQKATTYLNDPAAYAAGPGQAALKGTLAGLSVQGNPFGSGTALQFATDTGNKNWLSAVNSLGSLGLGGQGIQANLDTQAVGSDSNMWNALGATANNIFNPAPSQAQTLSSLAKLLNPGS